MKVTTKEIVKILTLITLFLLGLLFLYNIRRVLGWIVASFLIAMLLNPLVEQIQRVMPKKKRILAIIITAILLFLVLGFFGLIMIKPLVQEYSSIANEFSRYLEQAKSNNIIRDAMNQIFSQSADYKQAFDSISGSIGGFVASIFNGFFAFITIVILAVFMLVNPDRIIKTLAKYIPTRHRKIFHELTDSMSSIVPRYFAGVLITTFTLAVATYVPLLILNVPYSLALSVGMFFFGIIPLIGATLGMIFITLFCFMIGQPVAGIIFFVYILVYQQIENNLIVPFIQRKTVSLSPLSVLLSLLIGSAAAGMVGALLAIPTAAIIKVTYSVLVREGYIQDI